jgi:LysM repeat protein
LEVLRQHPDSAAAHQELGYLYFENLGDYVSALYHLKRFGGMDDHSRTNSTIRGDVLDQVQLICKQEIAKEIALGGLGWGDEMQELEKLTAANKDLRQNLERVSEELAMEREKRVALESAASVSVAQRVVGESPREVPVEGPAEREGVVQGGGTVVAPREAVASGAGSGSRQVVRSPASGSGGREQAGAERVRVAGVQDYTVRKGDTFYNLARRAGVTVADLQRLNPSVRPANLQIGQRLKIPQR